MQLGWVDVAGKHASGVLTLETLELHAGGVRTGARQTHFGFAMA